jgi:transposase
MQIVTDRPQAPTAIRTDLGAIFVSLELSRSTWLVTSLSPGGGEKMSKHTVRSGDVAGLRTRFSQLKDKVQIRTGQVVPINRNSGGGSGRLLDPPIATGRRGRKLRC